MGLRENEIFYHRNLPHYQPPDAVFSVVFRLAGSLPAKTISELRNERDEYFRILSEENEKRRNERLGELRIELFKKYDALLDRPSSGPRWLMDDRTAKVVGDALMYWDRRVCEMIAYCIMSNHVHAILATGTMGNTSFPEGLHGPTPYHLTNILTSIKKFTARKANIILGLSGAFWQDESYDHVVRENELTAAIHYVLNNPVKAGLVKHWREWRWSYLKEGFLEPA